MIIVTKESLIECSLYSYPENIELYYEPFIATLQEFGINDNLERIAAFVAQTFHESMNFKYTKENLNYSKKALLSYFSKYFTEQEAERYQRNSEAIANRIYADRMGNGPEDSGDGWRYRGRGLIQITGKENYIKCANFFDITLENIVEYLETPEGACRSSGWFWTDRKLNTIADTGDIKKITKIINGSYNGLEKRIELYENALVVFSKTSVEE